MNAPEVLEAVQNSGGSVCLSGERIQYVVPESEMWLVRELQQHRDEIVALLKVQQSSSWMPAGVRLLNWKLKKPPAAIINMGIVTDVNKFVATTLLQLRARLEGKDFLAGNWSLRELIERLEQVGVKLAIESADAAENSHE